jgi:putative lipoic acid-binding regulatory protein
LRIRNSRLKLYICFYFDFGMDKKTEEFYERLKVELDNTNTWPAEYLFKFIVPTDNEKIHKVETAFDRMGAIIKTNKSKTGKFTSISIDVTMKSAQDIIDKYQEVATIEGIISL